jgi:hypothetical protein
MAFGILFKSPTRGRFKKLIYEAGTGYFDDYEKLRRPV